MNQKSGDAGSSEPLAKGGKWKQLRWSLPFLAALLPIILLSLFSYQVASQSVQDLVEAENNSAAANVSQLITQDLKRTTDLSYAIASVPGTLDAIRRKDDIAMRTRLKAIVLAYPQIDRVFMTDRAGMLWTDYPQVPAGVFAKNQEQTEWYRGLSQRWKTYISNAYIRPHDPSSPVVAISTPVFDETGRVIGALVFEYRTEQIRRWLQNIHVGRTGHIVILDKRGMVIAHPRLETAGELNDEYTDVAPMIRSRSGGIILSEEYADPVTGQKMIANFQPLAVGTNTWTVLVQQPTAEAYALLNRVRLNISAAGGILTLVTIGMVIALAYMSMRNERLNKELASKNSTLQDITSFVSHQLRAPVTAMKWTIEGIIDGDYGQPPKDLIEPLESLKDVAIQNGNLINDILNVSRIDRGVIEVAAAPVQLAEIAERALRDYRIALEKAGLSLTVMGEKENILVMADKEKMAESVTNAISNAIKHTKTGGITVTIRKDAEYGYIDVTDTGEGMSAEILDKLFNRTGIKGSNTNSAASTGLGLYIARNFMQMQKGDIIVTSEVGKGSTFSYKIPLAAGTASAQS